MDNDPEKSGDVYHMLIEIFKFMYSKRGELDDPDFIPDWKKRVSKCHFRPKYG